MVERGIPESAFRPTPPCPDCGARMVWDEAIVSYVDEVTHQNRTAVRVVDASRHEAFCPQRDIAPDERAVAIRAGGRSR